MYFKEFVVKWADIDANGHMRNTAYSEYATHLRFSFFDEKGYDVQKLAAEKIGPIIIKEETTYFREVKLMESIKVTCELTAASPDFLKFNYEQLVFKGNGKRAARLRLEAIWLDIETRKPRTPSQNLQDICQQIPISNNFEWLDRKIRLR